MACLTLQKNKKFLVKKGIWDYRDGNLILAADRPKEYQDLLKRRRGGDKKSDGSSSAITSNNFEEGNFTMFGVGCSFSDNDQEKDLRNEITDQACRGWFSAGAISSSSTFSDDDEELSTTKKDCFNIV